MPDSKAALLLEECFRNCRLSQAITVPDKGLIYRQGDPCPHIFLIIGGIVKLDHINPQGNLLTTAVLRRGDLIGCLELNPTMKRAEETARAVGEACLYRCGQAEFRDLISSKPEIALQLFDRLSLRRRQAERKLQRALTESVERRVIETLKDLSETFGIRCTHGYALEIHLTQQELADLVGANRSVVSTTMNELRARRLLDYTRDLICVHDRAFTEFCKPVR